MVSKDYIGPHSIELDQPATSVPCHAWEIGRLFSGMPRALFRIVECTPNSHNESRMSCFEFLRRSLYTSWPLSCFPILTCLLHTIFSSAG